MLNSGVTSFAVSDSTVYVGGWFTTVAGQGRSYIAALDASTGLVTPWNPGADLPLSSMIAHGSIVYAGGNFSGIGGQARTHIAALDAATGLATARYPIGIGASDVLDVIGATVYVSGGFSGIDATTGLTLWNLPMDGGVGTMATIGSTMYVGGYFSTIGGQRKQGFAVLRDFPTPTLLARFEAEATSAGVELRWQFGQPGRVVSVSVDRASSQIGPWTSLTVESHVTGDVTEALDMTTSDGENYYYRLTAILTDGTRTTFAPIRVATAIAGRVSGLTGIAPNPTVDHTSVSYALVRDEKVRISIVDVTGREIAVLADEWMAPGSYSRPYEVRGGSKPLRAGVYFVRWASAGGSMNRKLVVLP